MSASKARSQQWLGTLPTGWKASRLKYLVLPKKDSIKTGPFGSQLTAAEMASGEIKVYNQRNVIDRDFSCGENYVSIEKFGELKAFEVFSGDILLTTRGTIGRAAVLPEGASRGILHPCLMRLQCDPTKVSQPYLLYMLSECRFVSDQIAFLSNATTIEVIYSDNLKQILLPVPPLSIQLAIAAYLDRKTAEIDAVIAKKERLIALLQEERQALISRAVTRGLDAGVAMKDSGVDWLGNVPKHWEVRRVGTFCRVVRGASPRPAGDPLYFNGDAAPWITVAEITKDDDKYLQATDTFLTLEGQELSRTLPVGTFVLTNSGATLGVPKILKISGCINDGSVAFFDLIDTANKDFLYYFFTSQTQHLRERMNQGMGQPNLNTDLVRNIAVPFPPPTEQREIADFLDMRCQRSRELVLLNQNQIAKFREYRQALISAAVTGKLAVPQEVNHAD